MYTKRIQVLNYGPIEKLEIEFPFDGETPKPVVVVGENGSGKSILLSYIVNGLVSAKGVAYPETPEVDAGKVYKLRSSLYIKPGSEYYFGRVDFEGSFFIGEMRTRRNKEEYTDIPEGISETAAQAIWKKMSTKKKDYLDSNITSDQSTEEKIKEVFAKKLHPIFPCQSL